VFEANAEVGFGLSEGVEDGDADPEGVEGSEELVAGAVHVGHAEIGGGVEVELVGYPDAEIGDGEDGHQVGESPQEEEVGVGLEPALFDYVVAL
jgi:hypothetical protein